MVYIVADTNFYHVSYEKCDKYNAYYEYVKNDNFQKLKELQSEKNTIKKIKIIIPEMVISELSAQKVSCYSVESASLKKLESKFGKESCKIKPLEEYKAFTLNQFKTFFIDNDIEIVPICNSFFKDIVERSIEKLPPFEGTSGNSDKGFKDTVIFYSLVEYADSHPGEYYFLSKDKIFLDSKNQKSLKKEFLNKAGQKISFYSDIESIKSLLVVTKSEHHLDRLKYKCMVKDFIINSDNETIPIVTNHKIIEFIGNERIVEVINKHISGIFTEHIEWLNNIECYREKNEPDIVYESVLESKVYNNTEGILSICFIGYEYFGGAHGTHSVSAYSFDLNEGRIITLSEVVGVEDSDLYKMIELCVNEDIQNSKSGKYFEEEYSVDDISEIGFYIKDKKVYIFYNEYELGPYASGIIELKLCDLNYKQN